MSREKGTVSFSANFEAEKAAPIDARMIVDVKSDLIETVTWQANDGYVYTYRGMIVSVHSDPDPSANGLYRLCDDNFQDINNWELLGSGSVPLDATVFSSSEITFYLSTNNSKGRQMHWIANIPSNLHGYINLEDRKLKRWILRTVNNNSGTIEILRGGASILTLTLSNNTYATGFVDIALSENDELTCYISSNDGLDKPVLTLQLM